MGGDIGAVVDKIGTLVLIGAGEKVPFINVGKDHQLVAVPGGKYSAKADEVIKKITELDSILLPTNPNIIHEGGKTIIQDISAPTKPGDPNYPYAVAYHCGIGYGLPLRYMSNEPQQEGQ